MTVTLAPAPGHVSLPDGTRVQWVSAPTIDLLADALAAEGITADDITPAGVGWALTRVLSHAQRHGERWVLTLNPAWLHADGVTHVDLVAEHHDDHGWIVALGVPN